MTAGWIELLRPNGADTFNVRCVVGDFTGSSEEVWIDANEQRRFQNAIRLLERDRRGEARLVSMSPEEFELIVRVVDRAGHVAVEGLVGRIRYSGHQYNRLLLKFAFDLDPTFLPQLVREAAEL